MKVMTKAFGEIEVSEKQRISFKEGIFGFEDISSFILIDAEEGSPFYWLQAEHMPEIAFVMINPYMFTEYVLDMEPEDLKELDISDDEDILIFCIVTVADDPSDITVNLLGPVIINRKTHIGKQIISLNEKYQTKHPLFQLGGGDNADS
jgi:flagellar assembly factor FliW